MATETSTATIAVTLGDVVAKDRVHPLTECCPTVDIERGVPKTISLDHWALDHWVDKFRRLQRSAGRRSERNTEARPAQPIQQNKASPASVRAEPSLESQVGPYGLQGNDMSHPRPHAENNGRSPEQGEPRGQLPHELGDDDSLRLPSETTNKEKASDLPESVPVCHAQSVVTSRVVESKPKDSGVHVGEGPSRPCNSGGTVLETGDDLGHLNKQILKGTEQQQLPSSSPARIIDAFGKSPAGNKGKQPQMPPDVVAGGTTSTALGQAEAPGGGDKSVLIKLSKSERVKQLRFVSTRLAKAREREMPLSSHQRLGAFAAFLGCSVEAQINTFGRELPSNLVPSFVQIDEAALSLGPDDSVTYICICGWTSDEEISHFHRILSKSCYRHLYEPWKLCYEKFPIRYLAAITSEVHQLSIERTPSIERTLCGTTMITKLSLREALDAGTYPDRNWYSTIGGLIEVDGVRYAITTAHRPRKSQSTVAASSSSIASDTLVDDDGLPDTAGPALVLFGEKGSSRLGPDDSVLPISGSSTKAGEDIPLLTVGETIERHDWRLVPVGRELQLPNRVDNRYIFHICQNLNCGGRATINTPSGTIGGRLSVNPSFLVSGTAPVQQVWTMVIDEPDQETLQQGHSGSWAFVTSQGKPTPFGPVIAISGGKAFLISLDTQFKQIRAELGAPRVQLPSPVFCLLDLAQHYSDTHTELAEDYIKEASRVCSTLLASRVGLLEQLIRDWSESDEFWPYLENVIFRHGSQITHVMESITEDPSSWQSFVQKESEIPIYRDLAARVEKYRQQDRRWGSTETLEMAPMPDVLRLPAGTTEKHGSGEVPPGELLTVNHPKPSRSLIFYRTKGPISVLWYTRRAVTSVIFGVVGGTCAAYVWRSLIPDAPSRGSACLRGIVLSLISSGINATGLGLIYVSGVIGASWPSQRWTGTQLPVFLVFGVLLVLLSASKTAAAYAYILSLSDRQSEDQQVAHTVLAAVAAFAPLLVATASPFCLSILLVSIYMRERPPVLPVPPSILDHLSLALQKHVRATTRRTEIAAPILSWGVSFGFQVLAGYTFARVSQNSGTIPLDDMRYYATGPAVAAMAVFSSITGFPLLIGDDLFSSIELLWWLRRRNLLERADPNGLEGV